ncbi:MAG: DUF4097 domain-containing protein [Roseburia sp.]|nr:DUF4097 domain-containing protein [Roseburia sp.]
MKEKNFIYTVETDVNLIELNLFNAALEICEAEGDRFYVEYPNAKNIFAANDENGIIIHQGKSGFLLKPKQDIKIFVPAHTVPSLKICGRDVDLLVKNGIYGELNLSADDGTAALYGCVFESVEILGGNIDVHFADATIKSGLNVQADKGEILAENTFITRAEARVKRGNIGIVNVSCKDCAFDTQRGNITASLKGCKEQFTTSIVTREGTVSRESEANAGAEGVFHAYTKKGNIVLDFLGCRKDMPEETLNAAISAEPVPETAAEREKENA